MDLSIIIVNYNTKDLLHDCLVSISKTVKKLVYETIIVDNNSSDGSW
jgi:GT2 family glycosyltransferase